MIHIRKWQPEDLPAAHAINEAAVPAVSAVTMEALKAQVETALTTLVAVEDGVLRGFLLCYGEDAPYRSPNYLWFVQRYGTFAYVDRVAVEAGATGRGLGAALYDALEAELGKTKPLLLCEVNLRPPNPGSLRFHQRRGFTEVGRLESEDGEKEVVMLAKDLRPLS